MKKILLTATVLVSMTALTKAQQGRVGINTTTPAATLDVTANTADATRPDALLVPRMSRAQLEAKNAAYANGTGATNQNGALVFVNAIDGAGTGKTVNVTATGFYYYDAPNNVWVAVGGGGAAGPDINIYANDGTLTGPRVVTQANNNLTFTTGTARTIINGTQQTNGAMYLSNTGNVRTSTVALTSSAWTATDYIVISTTGTTINLPDATANPGRILVINNQAGNATFGGTDTKFKPVNYSTLASGRAHMYISNGSEWYLMAGGI